MSQYMKREVCTGCGYVAKDDEDLEQHTTAEKSGYTYKDVQVGIIHHDEIGHDETKTVILDRKCSICGILDSQL